VLLEVCLHRLALQVLQLGLLAQRPCYLEFDQLGPPVQPELQVQAPQPLHHLTRYQTTLDANCQNMTAPWCKQKTPQPNQT
jgi:hypothetical protein